MKDYLTDLETSKRLKEAGVVKESKWYHVHFHREYHLCIKDSSGFYYCPDSGRTFYGKKLPTISAYLLSELLDMVEGEWRLRSFVPIGEDKIIYEINECFGDKFQSNGLLQAISFALIWQKEGRE